MLSDGNSSGEDQVLETDIMRFVAIIGIIFWIIFALVKSIPLQPTPAPAAPVKTAASVTRPAASQKPGPEKNTVPATKIAAPAGRKPSPATPTGKKTSTLPKIPPKTAKPAAAASHRLETVVPVPKPTPVAAATSHPSPTGHQLRLEFSSRADLFTLLANGRVAIFCRAQAPGFDLYFAAEKQHGTGRNPLFFASVAGIPQSMWQITSGSDRDYFLARLADTFPAINSFSERQVYVAFNDKQLEKSVGKTYDKLRRENRGGTITINGDGTIEVEK